MNARKVRQLRQQIIVRFINLIESDVRFSILQLCHIFDETKGIDVSYLPQSTTYSHFRFTIHKRRSKQLKFYPFTKLTYRLITKKKRGGGLRILFRSKQGKRKTVINLMTVLQKLCNYDPKLIIRIESLIFDIKG